LTTFFHPKNCISAGNLIAALLKRKAKPLRRRQLNLRGCATNSSVSGNLPIRPRSDKAAGEDSKQDNDALNPAIEELLDQIEEIIDAFGLEGNE